MSTALLEPLGRTAPQKHLTCCPDCGRLAYESGDACRCGGMEKPEPVSHFGEIYSYTIVHQGAGSFVLALVRLSGGQLVTGRVVGVDRELKVGLPVEFTPDCELSNSGSRAIYFRPRSAKAAVRL